ncbi:MAG: AsmA family protein [Prevotellaceae bacterium]|jgi:hypothetical protein|nr:AsmA family protein [Prevotellaceae bacterium]
MKKVLLITGIVIVAIFAVLLTAPLLFKDEIKQLVLNEANKQLNATIELEDVNISFIRSFPNASIKLENLLIVGKDEFAKDTLVSVQGAYIVVDIKSFFGDTGYIVKKIELTKPNVYAHVLPNGKANWDITKPDTAAVEKTDTAQTNFKLSLKKFEISNAHIRYNDEQANMSFAINDLNHTLSGDLTAESTVLATTNSLKGMTFRMQNVPYLNNAEFKLEGDIDADLKNMKFTVKGVHTSLNAIVLNLDGWFQMLENGGYDMDLKLGAPDTQFKDILSLVPAIYSKDFSDIQTKGKVRLDAFAKGIYNETTFPAFHVNLEVSDAWFKYPALPKSVDNINITAKVDNPGGSLDNTKVNVAPFSFVLGGNPFSGSLSVATPMSDPDLTFAAKGIINLGMVKDVYPMDSIGELSGVLDADLSLKGKMSYYEKQQYEKFFFTGKLNLADMILKTTALPNALEIKKASLLFNPKTVSLPALQIKVGKSDLAANGSLTNFIPFVLKNQTLKGTLNTSSQYLNVSDFMAASDPAAPEATDTSAMTVVLIPNNLNFTLNSSFKEIDYDNIKISNAQGNLQIIDSKLIFKNLSMAAMGGTMALNGTYNTQDAKSPDVNMNLKINNVVFAEVYKQVATVQKLAPIFQNTTGKFSTDMSLQTRLGDNMMPVMNTLSAKGVLSSNDLSISNVKVMNTIATVLRKDEFKNPHINKVAIPFEVKNGRVYTSPFSFAVADTKINVDNGSTGIDQTIDYTLHADVPTPEASVVKLNKLGLKIGGTFSSPKVSLQTKELVNEAVNTLKTKANEKLGEVKTAAKEQLNEATENAKEELKENVGNELKQAGKDLKESGKDALKGLFKR